MEHGKDIRNLTEEEKLQLRSQRFNFGGNVNTLDSAKLLEVEKKKILERQKKFGVITLLPEIEEEKKKQRLARFGDTSSDAQMGEDEEKKKKRAERFGMVDESDLLKKRAERFKGELDRANKEEKLEEKFNRRRPRRGGMGNRRGNNRNNRNITDKRDRRGPKRLGFRGGARRGRGNRRRAF